MSHAHSIPYHSLEQYGYDGEAGAMMAKSRMRYVAGNVISSRAPFLFPPAINLFLATLPSIGVL